MNLSEIKLTCKDFGHFDLAVIGGGCAGLFAAVRAARLGLKVAIIEKTNCFGGVATNGLVNVWHSLFDIYGEEQIIAGLTDEVEQLLLKNGHGHLSMANPSVFRFDPNAMKPLLDTLATQSGIQVFFHTLYCALTSGDNRIESILVSNKDGMGKIYAGFFIDATGDGDLCRDVGLASFVSDVVQPPSPCCLLNKPVRSDMGKLIGEHGSEFGLDDDWGWEGMVPGFDDLVFRADFHVFGKLCSKAEDLTLAEIEGRRKIYALDSLLRKYEDPKLGVAALSSQLGVRETVHYLTRFQANEQELLLGKAYPDTVMKGTYRIDIHHPHDNGITFKYLTGEQLSVYGKSKKVIRSNWREELGITQPVARFYQIPFDILVQEKIRNLIPVGRMINADTGAFGALRVMVNLNQLAEAAGVGAYLCLQKDTSVTELDGVEVRRTLQAGGSV